MTYNIDISVILPVYNEEKNIIPLIEEIFSVFENVIKKKYEIIVVDDASSDGSAGAVKAYFNILKQKSQTDFLAEIKVISHRKRVGQSAALTTGVKTASGALLLTMDADMQYDPTDIPVLVEAIQNCDMVCGVRKNRSDGMMRLLCSRAANMFRNLLTGDNIHDSGCTFRIMKRQCVKSVLPVDNMLYGCEFFFHPLLIRKDGFKVSEIKINHRSRPAGSSHYGLISGRLLKGVKAIFKVKSFLLFYKSTERSVSNK
jgi:dolichol-phosphate mannosyltransferase